MKEQIYNILDVGRKVDPVAWTLSDIIAKSTEELGEFSKATQIKAGKIVKDQPKDEDFDECADVIITIVDALARNNNVYRDDDTVMFAVRRHDFLRKLRDAIDKKCDKWESKIPLKEKYVIKSSTGE